MHKIAVIQHAPVLLNRQETLSRAVDLIKQAADSGAELIVFPEAFISCYPAWIWRLRPGGDRGTSETLHQQLLDSAIDLSSEQIQPICSAAKQFKVTVICGLNERDNKLSRATILNSVLVIDEQGNIINHHRKLMPTNPERMVWGFGDGSGLNVVNTPVGRVGTLICWENYMPLARYSLYAQGVELYIAPTYDSGDDWLGTMQHIAREGRCWVICSGVALENSDIPQDFPERDKLYPAQEEWINPGDSVVIAPGGKIVAGPMRKEKGILYANIDLNSVALSRRALDVAGHYSRPDVFTLHVNTEKQTSLKRE